MESRLFDATDAGDERRENGLAGTAERARQRHRTGVTPSYWAIVGSLAGD
jgi:hypothetical protein